jgi:hypothetical protein
MFKHPVFTSFGVAIILSLLLEVGMEVAYPRRTGDMFGNEVITVLTFPVFWFLGWLVINAISWWREG